MYHLSNGGNRGINADVHSANLGISSARRKTNDQVLGRRRDINMATLHWGMPLKKKKTPGEFLLVSFSNKKLKDFVRAQLCWSHR